MWYARRQTQKNKTKAAPHLHLTSEQTALLKQLVSRIDNSKSNQTQSVRKHQSSLQTLVLWNNTIKMLRQTILLMLQVSHNYENISR